MSWVESNLGESCELYQPQTITTKDLIGDGKYLVYGANGVIGKYDKYNHEEPQLLVTCRGATCGSVNISSPFSWINGNAMVVKPKHKEISVRYLEYFFRGAVDLTKAITGAAQPQITRQSLSPIGFKYPPLPTQQKIVAKLDALFSEIDKATASAEANAKNAKVLLQNYLNDLVSREKSEVISLKLGDSELLQLIDGDRGSNYPNKSDFSPEGYCLFLNTKNVLKDGFSFSEKMFITKNKDETLRKGKLARGDVVLTTRGTLGNIGWYSDEVPFDHVRINSGMLILRANHKVILPEFLFELLRSNIIQREILNQKSGAAQPQLPIHTLKDFTIPIPKSLDTQSKYVRLIKDFQLQSRTLSDCYESKLRLLVNLKNSILQQAFNGELVKD